MKHSKNFEPYRADGGTNLRPYVGKSGVYFIFKKGEKKPIYIGKSEGNLYKTILRHFQVWNDGYATRTGDKVRDRTVYEKKGYLVRVIETTARRAVSLEKSLIVRYKPKDNPIKYGKYFNEKEVEDFWDSDPIFVKSTGFNSKYDFTKDWDEEERRERPGFFDTDLTELLPF